KRQDLNPRLRFAKLPVDYSQDAAETAIPIGKQINILRFASDPGGHVADIQPYRDEKYLIDRHPPRAIQRVADFSLEPPLLGHRVLRKTSNEEIRGFDGGFDRPRPVLPWQELAPVDPRLKAMRLKLIAEPVDCSRILVDVRHKYAGRRARHESIAILSVRLENSQAAKHDGLAFLQAFAHDERHLLGRRTVTVFHDDGSPCRPAVQT